MTSFDVGNVIKDRLQAAGLSQYLDDAKEQYLEFPDGFFAEVVLKDGSKLSEVQRLVKSIEEELRKQGVELDAIVRATWEVVGIRKAGLAPGPANGQRFLATLRSGSRECEVAVDMPGFALASVLAAFNKGDLRDFGTEKDAVLGEIVSAFLRLELSLGGQSYWDPILYPGRTLDENALQYVTMHTVTKAG
jgi:hypothetical protein